MTSSTEVRPLQQSERNVWTALFNAYADFYKVSVPDGTHDRVWQWIFDETNAFWCDVALDKNGRIVGFVQYQLMHRSLSGQMVCYLSDLYVDPSERGTGTGRALIDHVIADAAARGVTNVRWLTQEFNYTARQLYDRYTSKSDFILYSVNTNAAD